VRNNQSLMNKSLERRLSVDSVFSSLDGEDQNNPDTKRQRQRLSTMDPEAYQNSSRSSKNLNYDGNSPLLKAKQVEDTMSSELLKLKVSQIQSLELSKKSKEFSKITLKKVNLETEESKQPLNAYFPS